MRLSKIVLLISLAFLPWAMPAAAQRALSDEESALAIRLYLDTVLEDQQVLISCEHKVKLPIAGWDKGVALFVATLSASNLPEDVIREAKTRIEAPIVKAPCEGLMPPERLQSIEASGNWSEIHSKMLMNALGLKIVSSNQAISLAERAVGAVFEKFGPPQRSALRCYTVLGGPNLPISMGDWAKELAKAETLLGQSGLPGRLWRKPLDDLKPAAMLAELGDRKALLAACIADSSWISHFAEFRAYSFVPELEAALTPWIAATQQ
jgi:hypothetical protein